MKVKPWVLFSIASLVFVGCAGAAGNQARSSQPESIAQAMTSTKPEIISSGSFASGEHPTQGTARIISQNGKSFLELDQDFKTSNLGPDLVVILHRSANVLGSTKPPSYPLKSGDYVLLAPLRKFSGTQRYAIPTKVSLGNYKSAVIWCRKFNATFGAAKLNSQ